MFVDLCPSQPDGSCEDVLGAKLQLNVWMLACLSVFHDGVDQKDG
jgi:hypothetical protein